MGKARTLLFSLAQELAHFTLKHARMSGTWAFPMWMTKRCRGAYAPDRLRALKHDILSVGRMIAGVGMKPRKGAYLALA